MKEGCCQPPHASCAVCKALCADARLALLASAGVPFVLRAGKALNERSVVVRMQLHAHPVPLFGPSAAHNEMRNEFVMRLQPGEWMCTGRQYNQQGRFLLYGTPC